jgi:superkiller protein 3
MAKCKRIRTGAERNARQSAGTLDRGSRRSRRPVIVGSIVFAAVIATGIIVWQLNRVPDVPKEPPADTGRLAVADVTDSPVSQPGQPAQRVQIEALEEETLDAIGQLIKTLPESANPLKLMGTMHAMLGNRDEAVQWWQRCLKIDPKRPDIYDLMAQVASKKQDYEKAVELWGKALQINSRLPGIRNKLASVLIDSGKMDQAIAVLKEELDVSPKERNVSYFLLGKTYLQLRKYDKAQAAYEAAIEIQPNHSGARYGLARAYARLGRSDEAQKAMEGFQAGADTGQTGSPQDQSLAFFVQAHISVGMVYHANGYLRQAEHHWRRAAELGPRNTACRIRLATLYRNGSKYGKAAAICEQLVRIDPANAVFHFKLGILYADMNRLDAALAAVQRAIDLDPDSPRPRQFYQQIQKRKQREPQN